ncbi:uncharacterized protein N7459_009890 [Penicillium hispanicum]|uniref:uncharacterized protein n=1 Tax=Penicillium hispanicum TaxID=1080232 RepID=UPI0025418587|nr:uncharacterized protein N7459_009890 [Penicillium hispanicum]KAJ5570460.1 hypothetical protein N7459_009890 [Penicillium hispanicum]
MPSANRLTRPVLQALHPRAAVSFVPFLADPGCLPRPRSRLATDSTRLRPDRALALRAPDLEKLSERCRATAPNPDRRHPANQKRARSLPKRVGLLVATATDAYTSAGLDEAVAPHHLGISLVSFCRQWMHIAMLQQQTRLVAGMVGADEARMAPDWSKRSPRQVSIRLETRSLGCAGMQRTRIQRRALNQVNSQ